MVRLMGSFITVEGDLVFVRSVRQARPARSEAVPPGRKWGRSEGCLSHRCTLSGSPEHMAFLSSMKQPSVLDPDDRRWQTFWRRSTEGTSLG